VSNPPAALHITVPKAAPGSDPTKKIDLSTALQYGTAEGYPPLRSFLRQFTRNHLHPSVPYLDGPEIILTCGSTDGFSKVAELLVDPWFPSTHDIRDRPGMLCEAFVYMVPATTVEPKGVQVVPVETDAVGMVAKGPGGLEDVLENWDLSKGRRPHFMFTVT
jgi:DNA-binding transcriptional MocR family regulator